MTLGRLEQTAEGAGNSRWQLTVGTMQRQKAICIPVDQRTGCPQRVNVYINTLRAAAAAEDTEIEKRMDWRDG